MDVVYFLIRPLATHVVAEAEGDVIRQLSLRVLGAAGHVFQEHSGWRGALLAFHAPLPNSRLACGSLVAGVSKALSLAYEHLVPLREGAGFIYLFLRF